MTSETAADGNPGRGCRFTAEHASDPTDSSGLYDLPEILGTVLSARDVPWTRRGDALEVDGIAFLPQIVDFARGDDGRFQTTCTIEASHPTAFPHVTFEYQHAGADSVQAALESGFQGWASLDLPVYREYVTGELRECSELRLDGSSDGRFEGVERRVVLGPVVHWAQRAEEASSEDDHCFCPCCFVTKDMDAFEPLFRDTHVRAVRLYAHRDANGDRAADCRIDGTDWQQGAAALQDYARTWPERGFEVRKQLVIFGPPRRPAGDG